MGALTKSLLLFVLNWLDAQLTLVWVPIFNPDGNDRISTENRKLDLVELEGQIGPPGGVGTRNTGEGWDLNRDYMKQEAHEMRLLQANVCRAWRPQNRGTSASRGRRTPSPNRRFGRDHPPWRRKLPAPRRRSSSPKFPRNPVASPRSLLNRREARDRNSRRKRPRA